MSIQVEVTRLPKCDFCGAEAHYDGRTKEGPWAYMCERCWQMHGCGRLGTGYGQRLVLSASAKTPNERLLERIDELTGEDRDIAIALQDMMGDDLDGLQSVLEDLDIL